MPMLIMSIGSGGSLDSSRSKQKGRALAALSMECFPRSALGELLAASRLVQADLLALHLARVARDETRLRQRRLERRVVVDQRTRDAVAHRARLAGFAATRDVHHDVERGVVARELERLTHDHAPGFAREEFIHGLVVDHEVTAAALEEHARDRAL